MAKHTPGPWTVETVKTSIGVCHKVGPFPGSCGKPVGSACVYEDGMALWRVIDELDTELLANARLMAAAPDMLAALKFGHRKLLTYGRVYPDDKELHKTLIPMWEAAIAKAEGR